LWVKFKSNTTEVGAINIFRYNKNGLYWNGANNTLYGYIEATTTAGIWVSGLNDDKWHHVVLTFEYSNNTIIANAYKDGVLHRTLTYNYSPVHTSQLLSFARYAQADVKWSISDFRVYATALSAEDIKNLYNSPIYLDKNHNTTAFEVNENALYHSKYWRTPTYDEMNYLLNLRQNASNLCGLCSIVDVSVNIKGFIIFPDEFVLPQDISFTPTKSTEGLNNLTLQNFKRLERLGAIFFPYGGFRNGTTANFGDNVTFYVWVAGTGAYRFYYDGTISPKNVILATFNNYRYRGQNVRLIKNGTKFSTSATTKIDFAPANLQYHCTQHIWRFAQHSYDIIGTDNKNISDSYNGWIDLFGYGTSGVNYSPTLHTTNKADYASGDIANTDNDWGINEIQSYDYNVKNFAANKNGIVQHNELRENDSNVNGCYQDKLITNELKEQ
jgi:hypothetical protein